MSDERKEKILTTYSMWSMFKSCRRKCFWRYIEHLKPVEKHFALSFGSLIHNCLEAWHLTHDKEAVLGIIDMSCQNRHRDESLMKQFHWAQAMMAVYIENYPQDDFEVVRLEAKFEGDIVNPATHAMSRTFMLSGKVDGIVRRDGNLWLIEHKTAGRIDGEYIDKLWTDFQISLYAKYVEIGMNERVHGVIYNILTKPSNLKQGTGETEEEFEVRREALLAKSKTGKTSAKRRMPELDEAYQERLKDSLRKPGKFVREDILFDRRRFKELQEELWELTQSYLHARNNDAWYQNNQFCYQYNHPCEYFKLCQSGGSQAVRDSSYIVEEPHEELRNDE